MIYLQILFIAPPPTPPKKVQKKQLKQSYSDNILRQQPDLFTGHCPMMMHHHTKFAYERLSGSEDVVQRQTINNLNVCCELDLKHSNPVSSLDTLAYEDLPSH